MKLEITHTTNYDYSAPVVNNVNEMRLTPRSNYRQTCCHHTLSVYPSMNVLRYVDYFGNTVHSFSVPNPHSRLTITSHSTVITQDKEPKSGSLLPLHEELALLHSDKLQNRYAEYLQQTSYMQFTPSLREYAHSIGDIQKLGSIYDTVSHISQIIHQDFTYHPGTTNVFTTASETLALKKGVCQDFTHLMLAVCRILAIPARYISGYHCITDISGGSADFTQASHAWVEAHIPGIGWLGFDPTNNSTMNWRYVKVAHGRDYCDIVPIKGTYFGSSDKTMTVNVNVVKLDDLSPVPEAKPYRQTVERTVHLQNSAAQ